MTVLHVVGSCNSRVSFPILLEKEFDLPVVRFDCNGGATRDLLFYLKTGTLGPNDIVFADTDPHDAGAIYGKHQEELKKQWERIVDIFTARCPNGKLVMIHYIRPPNADAASLIAEARQIKKPFANEINIFSLDFDTAATGRELSYDFIHFHNVAKTLENHLLPKIRALKEKLFDQIYKHETYTDRTISSIEFRTTGFFYNSYLVQYPPSLEITWENNEGIRVTTSKVSINHSQVGMRRIECDIRRDIRVSWDVPITLVQSFHAKYNFFKIQ